MSIPSMNVQPSFAQASPHAVFPKPKPMLTHTEQLDLAHDRLLSEESGFSYLPGITNLILAPWAMYDDYHKIKVARKVGDKEGRDTTHVRLWQNAAAFTGAVTMVIDWVQSAWDSFSRFGQIATKILRYAPILSMILCALEGILESIGIGRQTHFRFSDVMRFAKFLEKHRETVDKNPRLFLKELQGKVRDIEDHLEPHQKKQIERLLRIAMGAENSSIKQLTRQVQLLSSSILIKSFAKKYIHSQNAGALVALERRVGTWTCNNLDNRMKSLSKSMQAGMKKGTEARREMHKIFKRFDEQALKKLLAHVLGICAVILTAAAVICPYTSAPTAGVIITLFILGALFSIARYLVISGVYSQDGWKFSGQACLPGFISERINRQRAQYLSLEFQKRDGYMAIERQRSITVSKS